MNEQRFVDGYGVVLCMKCRRRSGDSCRLYKVTLERETDNGFHIRCMECHREERLFKRGGVAEDETCEECEARLECRYSPFREKKFMPLRKVKRRDFDV